MLWLGGVYLYDYRILDENQHFRPKTMTCLVPVSRNITSDEFSNVVEWALYKCTIVKGKQILYMFSLPLSSTLCGTSSYKYECVDEDPLIPCYGLVIRTRPVPLGCQRTTSILTIVVLTDSYNL